MITTALDSSNSVAAGLSAPKSNVLGKDDFLNLLITQLQNQDPLNPTDSVEFTAQLAQFSSLEQLGNVNENLVELKNFQASINNSQAVSLIGKTITANGNFIHLTGDGPVNCDFSLDDDAALVVVNIYDSTGEYVTAFEGNNLTAGPNTLYWNGMDKNGNRVADGNYTFEILAADANGRDVGATTYFTGTVDKVTFENNASFLSAGNQKIALADVIQVAIPATTQNTDPAASNPAHTQPQSSNAFINGGN